MLKVAAIFSNHMVLQRNKPIAVFGEGTDGNKVSVSFSYPEEKTLRTVEAETMVSQGKWIVYLPEVKECTGCTMTVSDGATSREFSNIAVGEVWLCGGQSNMEFELQNIIGGEEHLKKDHPNVRFYYTQKKAYMDEEFYKSEEQTCWSEFDSESAKAWSAVGYIFGKRLSEALGITVGLVGCNWGGTSASAWMSEEYLASDPDTNTYLTDYARATEGKTEEQMVKEYNDYLAFSEEWNKKCDACYKEFPGISWDEVQEKIGTCPWPGPMGCSNPFRPTGLYKTMIERITPYTMRGFLYYQGESDDHKPSFYDKLLTLLIKQWRADWKDETMPFLLVQLAGLIYEDLEDIKSWCVIRENQAKVAQTVPHAGMAVIIDAGEFNDIHPKDKEPVGERLYRQAMCKVYGRMSREEAESPAYEKHVIDGNKVIVSFKYAKDGLKVTSKTPEVIGFEIAGADGQYYPATAYVEGNQVVASAREVPNPVEVRYMWTSYPLKG
ncbi:MAG: sialate O-acetylesterase, partial [Agathobacter sp.]